VTPLGRVILFGLAAIGWLLLPSDAAARPGGGQGFSGGGGGGGGGGDLGALFFLVRLCFEHPTIGVPVAIVFFFYLKAKSKAGRETSWEIGTAGVAVSPLQRSVDFEPLRKRDPEFSRVLFEDFAYALYAEAQRSRHDPEALTRLAPYLAPVVREQLPLREPRGVPVQAAIVGALRVTDVRVPPPDGGAGAPGDIQVTLGLETNLVLPKGTQYLRESWKLSRSATARTRPWKGVRSFGCPACGAPFEAKGNRCASCGKDVVDGRFDWMVSQARVLDVRAVPPALTGTVAERGTHRSTVLQAGIQERWKALLRDDPGVTNESLSARLGLIFAELNTAWAAQDLKPVRPFVSDSMHEYLRYWVEAYRSQGLVNEVRDAKIERWVTARLDRDRHYDAVTVRLWGTGRDVTTEASSGRVVGGSARRQRRYTEYWTLIRGASVRGAPQTEKVCPSCGAPLAVSMAGNCEYCGTLVTSGAFDWVLSRIEQDDVYAG